MKALHQIGTPRSGEANDQATCRFCGEYLSHTFVDLGMSPLCESYRTADELRKHEAFYPLHVYVCDRCFLVQLEEFVSPDDIFSEYAYFSSYSDTWLEHMRSYAQQMIARFRLGAQSHVVEIASNDGYLLQYFVKHGIPALGIEPAANVAAVAEERGVSTLVEFFGAETARRLLAAGKAADLVVGNNVLAQVPDLNDFVDGMRILLKKTGLVTMEFPHLARLMEGNQFDTIYHEHFSYFSFVTAEKIFAAHDLTIFDVEELPTHGGSLRIYVKHSSDASKSVSRNVGLLRRREEASGVRSPETYATFSQRVQRTKWRLLEFLIRVKCEDKSIVGYGAPGKGNTLLNYCGIRTDFLDYTVDRNPYKHGKFLPGTHIPIFSPEKIGETRPDYVLILPWNLKEEIMDQLSYIRDWGGRFVVAIPEVAVYK